MKSSMQSKSISRPLSPWAREESPIGINATEKEMTALWRERCVRRFDGPSTAEFGPHEQSTDVMLEQVPTSRKAIITL